MPFKTVDAISKNSRTDDSLSDGIDRPEKWYCVIGAIQTIVGRLNIFHLPLEELNCTTDGIKYLASNYSLERFED